MDKLTLFLTIGSLTYIGALIFMVVVLFKVTDLLTKIEILKQSIKNNEQVLEGYQIYATRGMESVSTQYEQVMGANKDITDAVRGINERVLALEKAKQGPMNPDQTFN